MSGQAAAGILGPLSDVGVRGLAGARFTAILGSSLVPTALAFGVLALEGTTASSLGLVMAAAVVGQVVFLVPGGIAADRFPRRSVMVTAETVIGVAGLASGLVYLMGNATAGLLALLAGIGGVAGGFFFPAVSGIVPEVARPEDLQPVNALLRLSANVARIVGTAASGVVVALLGAGWALTASGALSLLSAVLVQRVRPRYTLPPAPRENPFADLREGWRAFTERRWVVVVVVLGATSNLGVSAALGVLGPLRVSESAGASEWALITTAFALGTVLGTVVAVRIRARRPLALAMVALGVYGLPLVALAAPTPVAVIAVTAVVAGLALDVFSVLWDTALQQHVPREALSRVSAFDWLGSFGLAPIALAAAGPLVDAFGLSAVLWGAAVLAATPPLALLEPEVRRLGMLGRAPG